MLRICLCLWANQMLLTLTVKVDQGLPCECYHISNVVVCGLLVDMMDTLDRFLGQSENDDEHLVISGD